MTRQPARKIKIGTVFAALVISTAILLTAWKGSTDWLTILLLLFFLVPNFRRPVLRLVKAMKGFVDDRLPGA